MNLIMIFLSLACSLSHAGENKDLVQEFKFKKMQTEQAKRGNPLAESDFSRLQKLYAASLIRREAEDQLIAILNNVLADHGAKASPLSVDDVRDAARADRSVMDAPIPYISLKSSGWKTVVYSEFAERNDSTPGTKYAAGEQTVTVTFETEEGKTCQSSFVAFDHYYDYAPFCISECRGSPRPTYRERGDKLSEGAFAGPAQLLETSEKATEVYYSKTPIVECY